MKMKILTRVTDVRMALPAFANIEELEAEKAAVIAVELARMHAEYLALIKDIKDMNKALGL